jgi:hypothetical protein
MECETLLSIWKRLVTRTPLARLRPWNPAKYLHIVVDVFTSKETSRPLKQGLPNFENTAPQFDMKNSALNKPIPLERFTLAVCRTPIVQRIK